MEDSLNHEQAIRAAFLAASESLDHLAELLARWGDRDEAARALRLSSEVKRMDEGFTRGLRL